MEFEKLIKNDHYQVFLFTCRVGVPLSFARHPWFVINKKGTLSRFDVFRFPEDTPTSWGHLSKDFYAPFEGIHVFYPFSKRKFKNIKLCGMAEGETAERMIECIESTPHTYPYTGRYAYTGPNSNTYAQWILNKFPESGLKLPWNAFGKRFTA